MTEYAFVMSTAHLQDISLTGYQVRLLKRIMPFEKDRSICLTEKDIFFLANGDFDDAEDLKKQLNLIKRKRKSLELEVRNKSFKQALKDTWKLIHDGEK